MVKLSICIFFSGKAPFLNRGYVVYFSTLCKKLDGDVMNYVLDKLVVYLRVRSSAVDRIVRIWNSGSSDFCDVVKFWIGHSPAVCSQNYTLSTSNGCTFYMGIGVYGKAPSEFWETVKLEFNPAKVGNCPWFVSLYNSLIAAAKYVDFKRFDVAIDIPVARSRLRFVKDQRKYSLLEYSSENKTEYLGVRSAHGNCKLYNKALEQNISSDLTRLEITLDYSNSSFSEFERIFPECWFIGSGSAPDELQGTDLVLYLACNEHPEYIKMLGRKMRKKIEQLLSTTAQKVEPDKESYNDILAQILWYGNNVKPEMWSEYAETDAEFPDEFVNPKPKFDPLEGEQEQM